MTKEYVTLVKDFSVEHIKGCRSREIVEVDEHNFIIIVEYEDISSVIDAQEALVSNLDRIRHLLVQMMMMGMLRTLRAAHLFLENREQLPEGR